MPGKQKEYSIDSVFLSSYAPATSKCTFWAQMNVFCRPPHLAELTLSIWIVVLLESEGQRNNFGQEEYKIFIIRNYKKSKIVN
jgi:hypothetical protein